MDVVEDALYWRECRTIYSAAQLAMMLLLASGSDAVLGMTFHTLFQPSHTPGSYPFATIIHHH